MNLTDENQNPLGIFTTDAALTVRVWDAALERMTGITAAVAVGKSIAEVIPSLEPRGLLARFQRVLKEGTVEMLAPAFHRFLIPCPPRAASGRLSEMRQRVTIAPLRENESIRGLLVTIEDVTERVEQEIELADRLKNTDDAVRLKAAKAISDEAGNFGEELVEPVIEGLGDKNWRVRRELARGLSRRAAPDAIAALLRAVKEKHLDFAVLNSALSVLQATSVKTTEALIEFLTGDDADLRMQAALTLGEQGDRQAIPPLLEALADENINVRFHAIEALGKMRAAEAVEPLAAIAESRDFFLSFAALEALRQIGAPSIASRILPLLSDETLREAAIETLGVVGDAKSVSPLIDLLNADKFSAVAASHAVGALFERFSEDAAESAELVSGARAAIRESGISNLLAALDEAGESDSIPLIRLGALFPDLRISARLADLLEDENFREAASSALIGHGASAVALLIERLGEAPDETRPTIARALGQIGDERAFVPVAELLKSAQAPTRLAAIEAVKALAHPQSIERLCDFLTDLEPTTREAAIRIIGYFGARGCENHFFEASRDEDERVRRAAIEQIAALADERTVPTLIRALKEDSPRVRETAAKALAHIKSERAVAALREALADEDSWTRYFAIRALGILRDEASRDRLSEMARRDEAEHVRAAAGEVLAEL